MPRVPAKLFLLAALGAPLLGVAGAGSARADQYDPPAGYYASATATTGPALSAQLNDIIDGHVLRSYDAARQALAILDVDPNDVTRLIAFYNGASLPKTWDSGATWNREHTWPRSLGVGSSGPDNSDLHMLRPCTPSVNGSRGNKPFGTASSSYWDPSALGGDDRGEAARAQFYAAVRYDGADSSTTNLTLVDTFPSGSQMGDKSELVEWHYAYAPDARERRRNHLIWDSNPSSWFDPVVNTGSTSYHQGNRNPFVDHPEFAWVIWGTGPNNATLFVGAAPNADGSSSMLLDLGRAIVGSPLPGPFEVPIGKANAHPAAFRVSVSGDAISPDAGLPMTYAATPAPAGVLQPTVLLDLVTGGLGDYSGTVTIDNAQLTSAGAGQGSADADDVITVTASIVTHANASFDELSDQDSLVLDFGSVAQGATDPQLLFEVHNLAGAHIAALDLDSIAPSGDAGVLTTTLAAFSGLPSGDEAPFMATLDADAPPGAYAATFTLTLSDEDIPGALGGQTLTLDLIATIVPPVACVGDIDGDGDTTVLDFSIFAAHFRQFVTPGTNGDFDASGLVDVLDFAILASDFGCTD